MGVIKGRLISMTIHARDADCAGQVDDAGVCRGCGVHHGDKCGSCGARAFHTERCAAEAAKPWTEATMPRVWFRLGKHCEGMGEGLERKPGGERVTFPRGCPVRVFRWSADRSGEIVNVWLQDPIGRAIQIDEPKAELEMPNSRLAATAQPTARTVTRHD